jgi:hypothetical protein
MNRITISILIAAALAIFAWSALRLDDRADGMPIKTPTSTVVVGGLAGV